MKAEASELAVKLNVDINSFKNLKLKCKNKILFDSSNSHVDSDKFNIKDNVYISKH